MLTSTQASHPGPTVVGTPGTIPHLWFHFAWLFGCWFIKFWVWPSSVSPCNSPRILLQTLRSTSQLPLGPHYSRPTLHPGLALQVPTFVGLPPPVFQPSVPLILNLALPSHALQSLPPFPQVAASARSTIPQCVGPGTPLGQLAPPELITLEGNHLSTHHHPMVLQGTEDNRG